MQILKSILAGLVVSGFVALGCSSEKTSPTPTSSTTDGGLTTLEDGAVVFVDANPGQGGPCNSICVQDGFTAGGVETDFKNGLVECQCTGTDGSVVKTDCENYCSTFGVAPAKSLLSGTTKCVCDGT